MRPSSITSHALKELLQNAGEVIKSKFSKLESFGYFLDEYVIKGAAFQVDTENPKQFTLTRSVISFEEALWTIESLVQSVRFPNSTYYVDFTVLGGFEIDLVHPGERYLPLWEFKTDGDGNIVNVIDKRGDMNYVRFKLEVLGINQEVIQAALDATDRAYQMANNLEGFSNQFEQAEDQRKESEILRVGQESARQFNEIIREQNTAKAIADAELATEKANQAKGEKGEQGIQGEKGEPGDRGIDGTGTVRSVDSTTGDIIKSGIEDITLTLNAGSNANQIVKRNSRGNIDFNGAAEFRENNGAIELVFL